MAELKNLLGQRFGSLLVIARAGTLSDNRAAWLCLCDCGNEVVKMGRILERGCISCGCRSNERRAEACRKRCTTHGHDSRHRASPEYMAWSAMWTRCTNPKTSNFHNYGGRGIRVCDRWKSFENFLTDMGSKPGGLHGARSLYSIDRIDNDGNYEPGNVRWATFVEQCRNRSTNKRFEFQGAMRTVAEIAELSGVSRQVLYGRLRRGKPLFPEPVASLS